MLAHNFHSDLEILIADAVKLNEIPAPTFDEGPKADYVQTCFNEIGLEGVYRDQIGNVLGYLPGQADSSNDEVVLAAHLDTVFPHGTDLRVRREKNQLIGPGIGDNNLAVASMLSLARLLKSQKARPRHTVVFAATVGEEGLGDLRGVRTLIQNYQTAGRLPGAIVAIEGHGLGNVCHQGVGSRRMAVTVRGPGGHSWDKAGRPNAIHGLSTIMHYLNEVPIPTTPRTSFNIGTIKGGISVNTIASEATMVFEVRSLDETMLAATWAKMLQVIAKFSTPGLTVETKLVGDRPAGRIPATAPIVELCSQVYRELRIEPSYVPFSTDANIPLSLNIPAVCIGISRGGNAHRSDEWVEIEPVVRGLQALARITVGLAF